MATAAEWVRNTTKQDVSPFGELVAKLLGELYKGIYHIAGEVSRADWTKSDYVRICIYTSSHGVEFATYDGDLLTRLVVLAHKHNIRIAINGAAYGYIWLDFVPVTKNGFYVDQHPTMQESIDKIA